MQVTSLEWIFTSSPATMLIAPLKSTYSFAICSGSLPSSMSERKIVFVSFASTFRNCIICRVVAVSRWLSRPANLISKNNGKAFSAASDEIIRHILPNPRRVKLKARKGSLGLVRKNWNFPFISTWNANGEENNWKLGRRDYAIWTYNCWYRHGKSLRLLRKNLIFTSILKPVC